MHVENRQDLEGRPVVLGPVHDPDLYTVQLVRGVIESDRQPALGAAHPVVGADGQPGQRATVHTVSGDPDPAHRGVRHDRQPPDRDTGEAAVRDHGKTSDRDTADRAVRHRAETADCDSPDRVVGNEAEPRDAHTGDVTIGHRAEARDRPPTTRPPKSPFDTAPSPPTVTHRARRSATTPPTPRAMPFTICEPGTRPAWIPLTVPVSGSRGFHRVTLMPFTRSSPASWMLMRSPFTRGALPMLMPQSWIVSPTWK